MKFIVHSSWFVVTAKKMVFFLTLLLFSLSGCASLKETARGVAGTSTKTLEENRQSAIAKIFDFGYSACYDKVMDTLAKLKAYVYAEDKDMVAVYVSSKDTTPVGIFLKEIDAGHTEVQVSSPSTDARETFAKNLFAGLEGKLDLDKQEPQDTQEIK